MLGCSTSTDWGGTLGMGSIDDEALAEAIAGARSWRGVLRALELSTSSGSGIKYLKRRADRLGLGYSHFTGGRRWTDAQLRAAIADARSWSEVGERLGLLGGSRISTLKGHARRLGLNESHLGPVPTAGSTHPACGPGSLRHLSRTGSLLAAAWFSLRGCEVAWPLEPCPFDLIATFGGKPQRIQVKTTQQRSGTTWELSLRSSGKAKAVYDPDDIDFFFGIDGDFGYYLIPVAAVGGFRSISLAAYAAYRLDPLRPSAFSP